jgi:hypothetical protein
MNTNDTTKYDMEQLLDVIKIMNNKLENQTIQLSTIAAQVLEQNEKLNSITIQSEYIGVKELERRFDIKEITKSLQRPH